MARASLPSAASSRLEMETETSHGLTGIKDAYDRRAILKPDVGETAMQRPCEGNESLTDARVSQLNVGCTSILVSITIPFHGLRRQMTEEREDSGTALEGE